MVDPQIDVSNKRDDAKFREENDTAYDRGQFPFLCLKKKEMVLTFVLGKLHFICLGVVVFFTLWIPILTQTEIQLVDYKITWLSNYFHCEINRKGRRLWNLKN